MFADFHSAKRRIFYSLQSWLCGAIFLVLRYGLMFMYSTFHPLWGQEPGLCSAKRPESHISYTSGRWRCDGILFAPKYSAMAVPAKYELGPPLSLLRRHSNLLGYHRALHSSLYMKSYLPIKNAPWCCLLCKCFWTWSLAGRRPLTTRDSVIPSSSSQKTCILIYPTIKVSNAVSNDCMLGPAASSGVWAFFNSRSRTLLFDYRWMYRAFSFPGYCLMFYAAYMSSSPWSMIWLGHITAEKIAAPILFTFRSIGVHVSFLKSFSVFPAKEFLGHLR